MVVKFTDLKAGDVVIDNKYQQVGKNFNDWIKHTDANTWQQLEVCEKTGFFDGQLVWCWDNEYTHGRDVKFYDVKNKCTFTYKGSRGGDYYNNYEPFEGNYPDWALEAFLTLNR